MFKKKSCYTRKSASGSGRKSENRRKKSKSAFDNMEIGVCGLQGYKGGGLKDYWVKGLVQP